MRALHAAFNWIRQLFTKGRAEREMQMEMQSHIEQQAALYHARGMSERDAMYEARREFGNVGNLQEQSRDARGTRLVEETIRDVRYGMRALVRTPSFTIIALLSLTLGIGVNTAMFTFMRYVFAPPRLTNPSTFVSIPFYLTYPTFEAFQKETGLFAKVVAGATIAVAIPRADRTPVEANAQAVSEGYFSLFEGKPLLGRLFAGGEAENAGGVPGAVLSHPFWVREYGSDSAAVGKTIRLSNGSSFTIVGVAAEAFYGEHIKVPDFWVPMSARSMLPTGYDGATDWLGDPSRKWLAISARLAPGVSFEQARQRVRQVVGQLDNADSSLAPDIYARMSSGDATGLNSHNAVGAALVFSATMMVLLIGCANVANLVLARGVRRRREIAVRLSLGAGRLRLIRQLSAESLILALAGGALALALSTIGLRVLATSSQFLDQIPNAGAVLGAQSRPTTGILLFTFGAAIISAVVCGVLPALRSTKMDLSQATRDDGAAIGNRLSRSKLRSALVVGQVAMSLVLLTTALVLLRSARNSAVMDMGFDRDNVVVAQMGAWQTGYNASQMQQFTDAYHRRLGSIVGDSNVARGTLPFSPYMDWWRVNPKAAERRSVARVYASEHFLRALGIDLREGRSFTALEVKNVSPVVVVSEAMARSFWPGQRALGQRFEIGEQRYANGADSVANVREVTVVGIAVDAQFASLREPGGIQMYIPADSGEFVVRSLKAEQATNVVRDAGRIEDPNLLLKVSTLNGYIRQISRVQAAGVVAQYAGALGAVALMLSLIGIFGVVAYAVSQRTREIGVRLAIGAQRGDVLRMVLRQGMMPVCYGAIIGLVLSALATQALRVMLFGVSTLDPTAYLGATFAVATAAALACYLPARRATRIDPVGALRAD